MKIGNKPKNGAMPKLNKWYWFIEIYKCPPFMCMVFRPHITIGLVKFKKFGYSETLGGLEDEKIGNWWNWSSPIGIEFRINRYK